jgi:hypothetical protein
MDDNSEIESDWKEAEPPEIIAYMNRGTVAGDYSFPVSGAAETADFALIRPDTFSQLANAYRRPTEKTIDRISEHVLKKDLISGEVWIITRCDAPWKGSMLRGHASVLVRGNVIRTKRVQIDKPAGTLIRAVCVSSANR